MKFYSRRSSSTPTNSIAFSSASPECENSNMNIAQIPKSTHTSIAGHSTHNLQHAGSESLINETDSSSKMPNQKVNLSWNESSSAQYSFFPVPSSKIPALYSKLEKYIDISTSRKPTRPSSSANATSRDRSFSPILITRHQYQRQGFQRACTKPHFSINPMTPSNADNYAISNSEDIDFHPSNMQNDTIGDFNLSNEINSFLSRMENDHGKKFSVNESHRSTAGDNNYRYMPHAYSTGGDSKGYDESLTDLVSLILSGNDKQNGSETDIHHGASEPLKNEAEPLNEMPKQKVNLNWNKPSSAECSFFIVPDSKMPASYPMLEKHTDRRIISKLTSSSDSSDALSYSRRCSPIPLAWHQHEQQGLHINKSEMSVEDESISEMKLPFHDAMNLIEALSDE